jgi:hypothetical protein
MAIILSSPASKLKGVFQHNMPILAIDLYELVARKWSLVKYRCRDFAVFVKA